MGGSYSSGSSSSSDSSSSAYTGSSGSGGTTHTVIVAPQQGVLRYVPFAVNASVGDTVLFHWNAGPHTVTKSSVLDVCNKTDDAAFSSGQQNASFVFTQVVNDTNPVFYYCGVPGHCQKGMFGIINPPNADAQPSSVNNMMSSLASNDSATAAAWSSTSNYTGAAASWGGSMDLTGMAGWAQNAMAQNVLFTRSIMAANPSAINADGQLDLSMIDPAQLMITPDVAAAAAASSQTTAASSAAPVAAASASAAPAASSAAAAANNVAGAAKNGAGILASPRAAVAAVAAAAAFFAL
jgi:plastocyanin